MEFFCWAALLKGSRRLFPALTLLLLLLAIHREQMSRPPPKRRRFNDRSTSSPSSHIFTTPSSDSTPTSSVLHPTSYEISLNHDAQLRQSLEPSTSTDSGRKTRLVTWKGSSGHSITTDRYDAIHLLSALPAKPQFNDAHDELGWSDLDSDYEDLFYMTNDEASQFLHRKAKHALEDSESLRLAQLESRSPPTPCVPDTAPPELSEAQFQLMAKTAKILASSSNASLLEMKILANHGADARFGFLRKDGAEDGQREVWNELKRRHGMMQYDEARRLNDRGAGGAAAGRVGLVAYDDSDSDAASQPDVPQTLVEAPSTRPNTAQSPTN